jgi:DNA-binding response OmpR family regulator
MKKILVTDEVMTVLEKDRSFMDRNDIKIFMVPSNDDVLSIHRVENADIIITTLQVSGMKCEDLCSAIRADDKLRSVSIIIICQNNAADLERSERCKANVIITQPVKVADLLLKVQQLMVIPSRESYRVLVGVLVEGSNKDRSFFGRSGNISTTGMLIETEKILAKGDQMACSFFLPGSPQIKTTGEIVRILKQAEGSSAIQYGVRFLSLTVEERSAIESFIEKKSQVSTSKQ